MQAAATRPYALLSIAAAVATIALKSGAFALTGSVGLLSDAAESLINLVAALFTFWALGFAALPPDREHPFGHTKVEYFAGGIEGALIVVAAAGIAVAAVDRFLHPQPIAHFDLGLALSLVASAINGAAAWTLIRAGKRLRALPLRADGEHLLTDVWTSAGVLAALVAVWLTGWTLLDPLIALAVAANILVTGVRLVREMALGLMDTALPDADLQQIAHVLAHFNAQQVEFHALRTRSAGSRRFVSLHVLVPGGWSVQRGHDLCEAIERAIGEALPLTHVSTHLEPIEDPRSWEDEPLDRPSWR